MAWSIVQSLDFGCSLTETLETVDDYSVVPLTCVIKVPLLATLAKYRVSSLACLRVLPCPVWCSTVIAVPSRLILVPVED